jgi:hypothetical protein
VRVFILFPNSVISAISVPTMAQDTSSSARALYTELASLKFDEGDCEGGADAATLADHSGVLEDERNLLFGVCLINRVVDHHNNSSDGSYGFNEIKRDLNLSVEAFDQIFAESPYFATAQENRALVSAKQEQFQTRDYDQKCELCFFRIKLEYDNMAFSGGEFELAEENCLEYKDEYDRRYPRSSR